MVRKQFEKAATGGVVRNLNSELVRKVEIPLPPIEVQKKLISEIEQENQKILELKEEVRIREEKNKIQDTRSLGRRGKWKTNRIRESIKTSNKNSIIHFTSRKTEPHNIML